MPFRKSVPGGASAADARAAKAGAPKNDDAMDIDADEDDGDARPATTNASADSTVTDAESDAMQNILRTMYDFRTAEGEDPSKLFHRKVNRRVVPDYYDVIKEPMAMSTIKAKLNHRDYKSFEEFVRDWALIFHNAQVYNSPNALAYVNALVLKQVVSDELKKLSKQGIVDVSRIELPYLGDIPPAEVNPQEEEEDDEEEDDEDEEDDSEDEGRKKRKRGRPSLASKREARAEGRDNDDADVRKRRGRPPRVDTPLEARIKSIMKGMRKPRNRNGELLIVSFERLPDKIELPDYFNEIKNPIALDGIKRKMKRKKYSSVDVFMRDVDLMFNNARQYNADESDIYQYAVELQQEAHALAEQEKRKPDSDFTMEDGRVPLPGGILHNGEVWRVGDWVHIRNENDAMKPIVAQIYRTWQDQDGNKWVNACWYYRPEQTVHRFDRHFWEAEVMKTGQYRDHPIEEVTDRCYVMFFTRYSKGRPRGFPRDKDVYVCECRYNEDKHKLNKIKTWASCLPDEVREKDYEMDLFDAPRKLKKVISPISYTLPKDAKETDDLPKPTWGASGAPPLIGAVHARPRDPKDSPPPEPTPTPPPQPPPTIRQISHHQSNGYGINQPSQINIAAANIPRQGTHIAPTPQGHLPGSYMPGQAPLHPQYQPSPSPAPAHDHNMPMNGYSGHQQPQYSSQGPQSQGFNGPIQLSHNMRQTQVQGSAPVAYKAPNPVEVWHLPDAANATIPAEIRNQFQQDAQGRILFFTAPPAAESKTKRLSHSPAYLAFRARQSQQQAEDKKRGATEEAVAGAEQEIKTKKARVTDSMSSDLDRLEILKEQAISRINEKLTDATAAHLRLLYGSKGAGQAVDAHLRAIMNAWEDHERREQASRSTVEDADNASSLASGISVGVLGYQPPNEQLEWRARD